MDIDLDVLTAAVHPVFYGMQFSLVERWFWRGYTVISRDVAKRVSTSNPREPEVVGSNPVIPIYIRLIIF